MQNLLNELQKKQYHWLVSGCCGFIGSNLVEVLLENNQIVTGVDNLSTGHKKNIEAIKRNLNSTKWGNFTFYHGDVTDYHFCLNLTKDVDYILHQAALGSVTRSLKNPLETHKSNTTGHLNILYASHQNRVKRVVYASSSSVYGDDPHLPKIEKRTGDPLSPYAITKIFNEYYSKLFFKIYKLESIGIRYFNVFGKRQDPHGPYAAVIPKWIQSLFHDNPIYIYGDGQTSRDYCYIENVVYMNLLAATTTNKAAIGEVFNCAVSKSTSLVQLFEIIKNETSKYHLSSKNAKVIYNDFRQGDIRHSLADISKANSLLGYSPIFTLEEGIGKVVDWYYQQNMTSNEFKYGPQISLDC